ncbi:hypothetical protein JOD45_002621 [Scopulibacillus daqui]|uniref:Uncharacterized protein n=1 Tax=Scopulibacillus daqui TaxID=1469162 RepID=A0ABS2Q272_9BACL|nr:hypothetical protein [Scopulibacillus daqui]
MLSHKQIIHFLSKSSFVGSYLQFWAISLLVARASVQKSRLANNKRLKKLHKKQMECIYYRNHDRHFESYNAYGPDKAKHLNRNSDQV